MPQTTSASSSPSVLLVAFLLRRAWAKYRDFLLKDDTSPVVAALALNQVRQQLVEKARGRRIASFS